MRPTTRGLALILAGGCLLVGGAILGYPELAVLGVCALVATLASAINASVRPALTVTREVDPDRVGREQPCTQLVTVRNRGRWRAVTLIAEDLCGGRTVAVPLVRLLPGHERPVTYPVPTHRRGVVTVGPLSVRRGDPLGLFRAIRTHGGTVSVWVYPRVHPLRAVPAGVARSLEGRLDRVPQGSITVDSLREYVIGDELRRVHWRTSARVGALMVREFVDTSLPRVVVLLDDRSGGYHSVDDFESACEAAASVVVAAVREDLAVRLTLLAGLGGPPSRQGHAGTSGTAIGQGQRALGPASAQRANPGPLLDVLAEAQPQLASEDTDGDHLTAMVRRLRQTDAGDTLVFLTGTRRPADLASIGALHGRYPTVVAATFGDPAGLPSTVDGVHLLTVADGAAFAAAWDGIGQW